MWILEEHIEKVLSTLEKEKSIEKYITEFSEAKPAIAAFLFSEDSDILTAEEKNFYTFLVSFYWTLLKNIKKTEKPKSTIIDVAEENWDLVLKRGSMSFRDSLDSIFDTYPETEALAFLEDSLEMEETDFLSSAGRDYIFVMIKSMIDHFLNIAIK